MHEEDYICTDGVYGVFHPEKHLKPHRKPRDRELSEEEVLENSVISDFRGDIERRFANLKNNFRILRKQFRHGDDCFNQEARICMTFGST